jgi:hypothetical protein
MRHDLGASVPDQALAVPATPANAVDGPPGFDPSRIADLELALELALAWLSRFEPGDSRAVSDEFVAMAAILCEARTDHDECRQIIRDAIATEAQRAETTEIGSVHG